LKLKIDNTGRFLTIIESSKLEHDQIVASFTKKYINWGMVRAKRPGAFKGFETCFVDNYGRVPRGLYRELQKVCKEYYFPLEIEGIEQLYDRDYDETPFIEWVNIYFEESEHPPRDYQIEGISRVLKYKHCTEEISTSGGKTMMVFMFFKYLLEKGIIKRMLYVVPSISLVTQSEEEFYIYEEECGKKPIWKSKCVFGAAKKDDAEDKANIVFGTYQSLAKKDLEYFSKFDAVFMDEAHHQRAYSLKNIILKCFNSKYNVGMSGTLPPEGSIDSFTVQAYLGPCVYIVNPTDLINKKYATPVRVVGIELDYLDDEIKKKLYDLRNVSADQKDGAKLLNLEKDLVRSNHKRLTYVCQTIAKTKKNSLVLFSDIKNDYGRNIFNWLKENTDKVVYYIDGATKAENRDYFKKQMEDNENVIIVASIGTFGEGVNIHNVHNIFLVESHRSQYIVRQALGRGMRLLEGKEIMTVIDFRDDFIYGSHKYQKMNYLMRHARERERIYADKGFPFKSFKEKIE
jgi:superfamily II DNA or RNA helicase